MKFRLREGHGECYYIIGVEDNGYALGIGEEELKISLDTLCIMTQRTDAEMSILQYIKGKEGIIAEAMIKEKKIVEEKAEIKIGMIGEENSGKSTLIGCLVSGKRDNGKGSARKDVFRHIHELFCGKTSSLSHQILGFNGEGKITNYDKFGKQSWEQILENSVKILNFYDMGGSEKALKTTVSKFYLE
jgi:GTPase